jgi:glycosyltransferase involved in cell wall biosynthesis
LSRELCIGLDAREACRQEPRGIGLYVRHLVREFGALARDARFLLYHQRPLEAGMFEVPTNMRPVRCDPPGDRFQVWERACMPWRMRRDRISVYHGTYNSLPPRWRAWPGPPMVVTMHDVIVTWHEGDLGDPFVRYARAITPRVLRDAAAILTVSEWSKRDIAERFAVDPARIRVSLNGIHPDFLHAAPAGAGDEARARHAGGRPYLFAIGAPLERKNTGRLLDAFGLVLQRRPDLPHLLLVSGLGRHGGRFRERAERAGCGERARFLPYLDRRELIAVYAGAELTVYPSLMEGWGIPVIESLALGTPVLTSNTTAMPEAGGEHARYFDPNSVESMAQEIAAAIDQRPAFAALREAAVARARTFTWTRTAEGILQVYREVAR